MDSFLIAILFCALLATGFVFLDRRNLIVLSVLLSGNLVLWYLAIGRGMDFIYEENSWMENIQAGVLLVSCVAFAFAGFALREKHRVVALFLAVLCFIFSFREVDVDELGVSTWLIFLLAEEGRAIFFLVALVLLVLMLKDAKYYLGNRRLYLRSSLGIHLVQAAILLIVLSSAFEKDLFGFRDHVFHEELSELLAYCLLFAASLDLVKALREIERKTFQQV
ncbi:MAG: hypothetical protein CMN05_11495 [Roseibacillus sp.]|jgi:hypothetical protein|nr:hypothetical protein [Roseibacillus sp.]MBP36356.1 hypothetical protein [Roseibacillus sp.]MCP4728990.1 hypothetical protein [Roseibacillus sp.]MDP7306140.1 hypothetical protein [Roseibacillus sp.]HJM65244.1 hypothetical protein [Roseibacillus sp.]|tara:strand:+ start:11091 stop:11756 length:666 start_codon:yes stop_codon:yes gene_type:complete